MSLELLLHRWNTEKTIASNISDCRSIPGKPAIFSEYPQGIQPIVIDALRTLGIYKPYLHQSTAFDQISSGKHVVIVTGIASGKSLCYTVPLVNQLIQNPNTRGLLIFPTKALAQDQRNSIVHLWNTISRLVEKSEISQQQTSNQEFHASQKITPIVIYDGDTPQKERQSLRSYGRLIFTNPDMLHLSILPHHTSWSEFFQNLEYIILDEIHIYRGIFGSHVSNVIRRLKRVAKHYGANLQFILTSATIGNPVDLAGHLIEEDVLAIDNDGAPKAERYFIIYNPPIINEQVGLRKSALHEAVRLADDLLAYDIQSAIFGRTRRTVELIVKYLRERVHNAVYNHYSNLSTTVDAETSIRGYRSGYLPSLRRQLERKLQSGEIRAIVATNALELGIDIGGLDASLMVGYPGTIASTWQQAGRAGRSDRTSVSILVTSAAPIDQYLAHHADYFFEQSPEYALINPDNLIILVDHLKCAVYELPFTHPDGFGALDLETLYEILEILHTEQKVYKSDEKYYWMSSEYPAQQASLRNISADQVNLAVVNSAPEKNYPKFDIIGTIDQVSAKWMLHPGAVYLHEGDTYLVDELNLEQNTAFLIPSEPGYYTEPRLNTEVQILVTSHEQDVICAKISIGELKVTSQVIGFRKINWFTHEQLGIENIDMPPSELITMGFWLSINQETVEQLRISGMWRNQRIDYGLNWNSQKERARARDDFSCQICGKRESGRAHDVHHKIPFRLFANFQQANHLDNLITLCPSCHHQAEISVRVRSGMAGLAFTLSHIAPLTLMCDPRDLGIHVDDRSRLVPGMPTIMLYEQIPAGIGLSEKMFESHEQIIARSQELVQECPCHDGCPSCVGPGGEYGLGGKLETLAILKLLTQTF